MYFTNRLFASIAVVSILATSSVAAAECSANKTPVERLLDLVDVDPNDRGTIQFPGQTFTTCTPLEVVTSAGLRSHDVSVAIPLCELDVQPLTPTQFASAISDLGLHAPWNTGASNVTWRVEEGDCPILHINAVGLSSGGISAWRQSPPQIGLTLDSGQYVRVEVHAPSMRNDYTAHTRQQLERNIEVNAAAIEMFEQRVAGYRDKIANPDQIKTGLENSIAFYTERAEAGDPRDQARLDELLAEDARLRTQAVERYRRFVADEQDSIADRRARIEKYRAQLASETSVREIPTEHDVTCDAA